MEPNTNNIDLALFALIEQKNFEELNSDEVKMVLNQMSETEFTQMRKTYVLVQKISIQKSRKHEIKQQLLQKFEQHKPSTSWPYALKFNSIHIAASMLIASVLTIPFLWKRAEHPSASIPQIVHDTVFLTRTEPPKLITFYDTVFIQKRPQKSSVIMPKTKSNITIPQSDLAIQSLNEMNQLPNQSRNQSLKDDTLIHTYGFVSL